MPEDVIDLVGDVEFVIDLLNGHLDWRRRLVREFVFASTTAEARVTSTYDVHFPETVLKRRSGDVLQGTARLVLPLGSRRKRLLLRLDIAGPNGSPAQLVLRNEASLYQAAYLAALLEECESQSAIRRGFLHARPDALADWRLDLWIADLLGAICRFTPQVAEQYVQRGESPRGFDGLALYLEERAHMSPGPTEDDVARWHRALSPVRAGFRRSSLEPEDLYSASELPLLVLPEFDRSWTVPEVTGFVAGYAAAVASARAESDAPFVSALAEYGRNFEVLVEATVPVDESFSVRIAEDAPLEFGRRPSMREPLPIGEAQSVHIEARVEDHTVKFARKSPVLEYGDGSRGLRAFNSWRATRETISLYASASDDDEPVELTVGLRSAALPSWTTWTLIVLDLLATLAVILAPHDDDLFVERLAVLVVPTTFAATVVLAREQSALAARLQARARWLLLGTLAALWLVMLFEIAHFRPPAPIE